MKARALVAAWIAGVGVVPSIALAGSELRYTCDPDGKIIEVHLSDLWSFEGDNGQFKGEAISWQQNIPDSEASARDKNSLLKDPIRRECTIAGKVYVLEVQVTWEGDLSEPHIDGQRFFPSVSIQSEGRFLLEPTTLGLCQLGSCQLGSCQESWAVRLFAYVGHNPPVVTAHRTYLDWISP